MTKTIGKRYIERKYGCGLPAGLGNLSFSSREAIKAEQKRMIEKIRTKLKKGQEITKEDLDRQRH
jgi:hypothetical protein